MKCKILSEGHFRGEAFTSMIGEVVDIVGERQSGKMVVNMASNPKWFKKKHLGGAYRDCWPFDKKDVQIIKQAILTF